MITGQANAPGEDPNKPWLETAGVPALTSNASMAVSRSAKQSSLTSHFPPSGSVRSSSAGPSSPNFSSTYTWSSGLGSHSTAGMVSSSSQPFSLPYSSKSSGSLAVSTFSSAQSLGSSGSGNVASSAVTSSSNACSSSGGASLSNNCKFPGLTTFTSTQTSQTGYVNPNPFGCSEIM